MSAAAQKPGANRMLFMLPLFFFANKIDYTEDLVGILRVVYYTVQTISLVMTYLIQRKVEGKKDLTKIYIPPLVSPFVPQTEENSQPKETTYYEHESEQVNAMLKQVLMGVAFVSFIHFKWGTKPVLLLQSLMSGWNMFDNGLFKKYMLGTEERVWGEKLEGEMGRRPAGASTPKIKDVTDEQLDAIQDKVYNKELGPDDLLKLLTKDTVNRSDKDGMTPLMVLSTRPDVKKEQVRRLLKLGAKKSQKDEEGNTALHWAAMKGALASVEVLTSDGDDEEIISLAKIKNSSGETALDLAEASIEPDHEAVLAVLEKASKLKPVVDVD